MTSVTLRPKFLLLAALLMVFAGSARAQDIDYLKHGKVFNYCWYKYLCNGCSSCENIRYEIKIKNNQDKKIKGIRYKLYTSSFDRVETKDAKIEGDIISAQSTGMLYICVPDIKHWAISSITYDDGSEVTFKVNGGIENFQQEPDECDCN